MYDLYEVAKERHKGRLHQAEKLRVLKQVETVRPGLIEKALIRFGDFLITTGLKVKAQYQTRQPDLKLT